MVSTASKARTRYLLCSSDRTRSARIMIMIMIIIIMARSIRSVCILSALCSVSPRDDPELALAFVTDHPAGPTSTRAGANKIIVNAVVHASYNHTCMPQGQKNDSTKGKHREALGRINRYCYIMIATP